MSMESFARTIERYSWHVTVYGTSGARMLVFVASKAVFDVDGLTASARSKRLPISSMISYKFLLARAM